MKRIFLILFCLFILTGCQPKETLIQGFSMDASYQIKAENLSDEQQIKLKNYLHKIDTIMDAYREDSLIFKLNKTKTLTVSDADGQLLFDLIQKTLPYCDSTFDISIRPVSKLWDFKTDTPFLPDETELLKHLQSVGYQNIIISNNTIQLKNDAEIELGAVAKGYVCDQVAEMLSEQIALIDIGGTVQSIGKDSTVGVKSPDYDGLLCSFTLPDGKSVSTSGSYERNFILDNKFYHHILNPKTGYPVETDLISVTVICDSALKADILSTTLFAENSFRIPDSAEVIYVTKDNLIYVSDGIQNFKLLNTTYQKAELTEE